MSKSLLDLILHPVRLRILQALSVENLNTQQISEALPDVPTSSIYRHLKLLLDNNMIAVAGTRMVKGIEEKTYRLVQPPRIDDPAVMAELTADEHIHYFTMYASSLIQSFAAYVQSQQKTDMLADRVGYSEGLVYASTEEIDELGKIINEAVMKLAANKPGEGRRLRKIGLVFHPVIVPGQAEADDVSPES